jgi:hypothetical protein
MKTLSDVEIDPMLLEAAKMAASADGITLEKFINSAILERLSAVNPDAYFAVRAARARASGLSVSDILDRAGDEPPRPGDEIDERPSRAAGE